jgi:hypothetical protein
VFTALEMIRQSSVICATVSLRCQHGVSMKSLRFCYRQLYVKKDKRTRFQVFVNVAGGRLKAKILVARLNSLKIDEKEHG